MEELGKDIDAVLGAIRDQIALNTSDAPTEPGVYRLPCGECYVDFFVGADGAEHWLVPGDETAYTRETVVIARHGEHPWTRLYSLQEAAQQLHLLAALEHKSTDLVITRLIDE